VFLFPLLLCNLASSLLPAPGLRQEWRGYLKRHASGPAIMSGPKASLRQKRAFNSVGVTGYVMFMDLSIFGQ